ncbi:MAG: tripartite tricarboxylate transporter TctB family protein [Chloroflexota bacterium]
MSDRLIGLVLLVASGLFYWQTYFFKKAPFAQFEQMGSEFLPRGILIGLAILGLVLLVTGKGSLLPSWRLGSVRALFTRYREVLLSLLLFPVYALGISLVGFLYSTVVYLVVMQLVLRPRRGRGLLYTVVASLFFAWGLVTLFQGYLHVVLPSGTLF